VKKALLIRFGGLGDLLVALPSIRLIRGKYPDARLTLACRKQYGELLVETGVVDDIIAEDSPRLLPLFGEAPAAEADLSSRLGSFDLVVGWTHGGKEHFAKAGIALSAKSGQIRFINADPRESGQLSRYFFRKTVEAFGASSTLSIDEWAGLPVGRLLRADGLRPIFGAEGDNRGVVVHPGSGSESKRWPLENFLHVIHRLGEHGVAGSLVTGEAEESMAAELENAVLPPGWTWVRQPRLTNLASLLSAAGLYLGNDSGVTHLAAACGAEVIVLFRQDLVTAWEPLGRVHPNIALSLKEIRLESVWEAIRSRLPSFSADSQNS
jgi:ADP-heptose:LPS heptosyltransferase